MPNYRVVMKDEAAEQAQYAEGMHKPVSRLLPTSTGALKVARDYVQTSGNPAEVYETREVLAYTLQRCEQCEGTGKACAKCDKSQKRCDCSFDPVVCLGCEGNGVVRVEA